MENLRETFTKPKSYKGKIVLTSFPPEYKEGACLITGKDHKKATLIKLINREGNDISYVKMFEKPVVREQSLPSTEKLMLPVLSFSFNPITNQSLKKGEEAKYPLSAGWIHCWHSIKKLLYEDREFLLYCGHQRGLLPWIDRNVTCRPIGIIRQTLPPISRECSLSILEKMGLLPKVDA